MYASAPLCGIFGYENTMRHLDTYPTLKAVLPVIRQGRHLACAINVFSMNTRPEGRKIPE
jgi:hypothetical protein